MNYTENYHLPQWEETDRIMRTDFNQMCADMEAGLEKTARDAAEDMAAVQSAALAAVTAGLGSDVPLLLGITVISALFVFGGNLIANILYGVIDPRIRRGGAGA